MSDDGRLITAAWEAVRAYAANRTSERLTDAMLHLEGTLRSLTPGPPMLTRQQALDRQLADLGITIEEGHFVALDNTHAPVRLRITDPVRLVGRCHPALQRMREAARCGHEQLRTAGVLQCPACEQNL